MGNAIGEDCYARVYNNNYYAPWQFESKVFNNAILHQMNSLIIPYLQAVEPGSEGEKVLLLCASQLSGWVHPTRPDMISKTICTYLGSINTKTCSLTSGKAPDFTLLMLLAIEKL